MARFYFPLLFWIPSSSEDIEAAPFGLHVRRWDVSIFDLYSLASENHPIRMPPEIMQLFLPRVNLEISIEAFDYEEAKKLLDIFRAMLYLERIAPTIAPFATNHSLNEYAGINYRSSKLLHEELPEGMRSGITAKDSKVEGWPAELVFSVLRGESKVYSDKINASSFFIATENAAAWNEIESKFSKAKILRAALAKAPLMPDRASSILHTWQALESVFGKSPELSFRMSLTLAELCDPVASRVETYADSKKSYNDRSEITHGKAKLVNDEKWMRAWGLLVKATQAILHRKGIPSEDELFLNLLSR